MNFIQKHIKQSISIAPLVAFRMLFGFIMFVSIIRFISKDWINQLYIEPTYFFSFIGDWLSPLGSTGMHAIFILMAICALAIMFGFFYKSAALLFFLCFTYVELLDKSNYLNHYYFVSVISFLLLFVPANRSFSIDAWRKPNLSIEKVPAYCINIFKLQLIIVYFYAGAAKLNADWLLHAMPLKIWLPAHANLPIIGKLLSQEWVAYAFSWSGAAYDLFIPFLLLIPRTRVLAYATVIIFHLLTRLLFPIGMFPYIMILSTLIFFSPQWHERNIQFVKQMFSRGNHLNQTIGNSVWQPNYKNISAAILVTFFAFQLLLPWRYTLYSGNPFWTEQGYRFSWRVMLMEKAGHATFYVKDPTTNNEAQIINQAYLLPHQEKQMSFQPDMIIQFAHFLESEYKKKGIEDPEVRVEAYVTLNGRKSKLMIDPSIDLTKEAIDLKPKKWVLPYAAIQE